MIVACNNADRFEAGKFCEVHFLSSPVIILPSTAIMQEQENDYVLIEVAKGNYIRRKVETVTVNLDSVRVVNGISAGENVVVKGGIYLNR